MGPDLGGWHVTLSNAGEMGRGEPILGTSTRVQKGKVERVCTQKSGGGSEKD